MRVIIVLLMMVDDYHNYIVSCFHLNINMSSNNSITLTGVFASNDVNNGIATTAVFSQSASNRGFIVNQCTFAETTSNRGLATGVVVFQGDAVNDGTVGEAVFLGASRNVGTVTASATFANSSSNAGVVHGTAVLVDVASNTGTLASNVQLGASASNIGTVFGTPTPHTQGDGAYAYGYYAGGVRTAPPDYTTVARQVGEFWYTYDAAGYGTLANGEYQDGSFSSFVFAYGVKISQTGGGVVEHPYTHLGYYSDDAVLVNGSSILYDGPFAGAMAVTNVNGGGVDLDGDGNNDDWTTDGGGVISWSMHIQYPYGFLGYFSDDASLVSGSSKLYAAQGTAAAAATNASGLDDVDGDGNADDWSTDGSGTISWSMHIQYPYAHLGYYSVDIVLSNGVSVLYDGQGTGAAVVANASGGGVDIDGDGNDDDWTTDGAGIVSWSMHIIYPYQYDGYFSQDNPLISGTSLMYNGQGTGASIAANIPITQDGDMVGSDGVYDYFTTDASGAVTVYMGRKVFGDYHYNPTDTIVVGTVLYTHYAIGYDDTVAANLYAYRIYSELGDILVSTDASGVITEAVGRSWSQATGYSSVLAEPGSTYERFILPVEIGSQVYVYPMIHPAYALSFSDTISAVADLNSDGLTPDIINTDASGIVESITYAS